MSRRLPAVRPREVLRALHPSQPQLRLPYHNSDLKRRTLESIIDQAGLTHEQFIELL
jgi:hypothetical protein